MGHKDEILGEWSANRKLTDHRCSISGQAPNVLRFFMAKYVTVTVVQQHAKVSRARRVPAVINRHDFPGSVTQVQPHGTFVRLISGIAFRADNLLTHGLPPLCGSPPAPRSRRRPRK